MQQPVDCICDCIIRRIIEDECDPKSESSGSDSPEDEENFKLKIPEAEELSDDDMNTADTADGDDELYNKFVASKTKGTDEENLFEDIEEEENMRKERLKHDENMLQTPDGSFDIPDELEKEQAEAVFTPEPLLEVLEEAEKDEKEKAETTEDKKFCCKKHNKVFSQSQSSLRMCASRQLYEQVPLVSIY